MEEEEVGARMVPTLFEHVETKLYLHVGHKMSSAIGKRRVSARKSAMMFTKAAMAPQPFYNDLPNFMKLEPREEA